MVTIRKIDFEQVETNVQVEDLLSFIQSNASCFQQGWRLFRDGVDITENVDALVKIHLSEDECELVMCQPYGAPALAWVAANWIYVAIAVGSAIVSGYLASRIPDASAQANLNRTQSSATNSFAQRTNEQNIGGRIDDIWGTVVGHVPRLMSAPRIDYVDNVEVEKFSLYIGSGKYDMRNVTDGDTSYSRLKGGKFNAWWPNGNPNHPTNRTPDYVIGGEINEPLVINRESRELQAAELTPPNDLSIGGEPQWVISSDTLEATFRLTNYESLEVDLREFFFEDLPVAVVDTRVILSTFIDTLYRSDGQGGSISNDFTILGSIQILDGLYSVTEVTENTFKVDISSSGWSVFSERPPIEDLWQYTRSSDGSSSATSDNDINEFTWFEDSNLVNPIIDITDISSEPAISSAFDQFIEVENQDFCDSLQYNFVSRSGFYKVVEGSDRIVSADIEIIVRELDEDGNPTGSFYFDTVTFTSNSENLRSQAAITHKVNHLYDRSLSLVRRVTDRDKGTNVVNVDEVTWDRLYFINEIPDQDYGNVTVAQVELPYSIQASGVKERRIKLDVTRYIEPYLGNGQFGPEQPVDTIAETIVAMGLDKFNGRLQLSDMDADLYLMVQQQLIDYYGDSDFVRIGYDFDSTSLRFQDEYILLWNAVTCKTYAQNAQYKVYPDILRLESSKQFTHRNKIVGTDTRKRSWRNKKDGIELTYRSNVTGDFETIILHVNGVESFNRAEMELSGAVSDIQAQVRAHRELNILKYQKENISFEGDGNARLTVLGERVDWVDSTRVVKRPENMNTYNIYDGEVVDFEVETLTVHLSEPVYFEVSETHSIRFTDLEGELMEAVNCTEGSNPYEVKISSLPSREIYVGYDYEKATFTFASDTSRLQMPYLIVDSEAGDRNNLPTRVLSAINYDTRYYLNDQDWRKT